MTFVAPNFQKCCTMLITDNWLNNANVNNNIFIIQLQIYGIFVATVRSIFIIII